jgi:hypothetical protein
MVAYATTTGALDYARVGIGTTSPWGSAGLRDQLTVAGRIYSTWRYTACDFPGANFINATVVTADTKDFCPGGWAYDQGGTSGSIQINSTSGTYPPFVTMRAAASNVATYSTTNAGGTFSLPIASGPASSSPTMEAWARVSRPATGTTTPLYIVGFTNHLFATALGTAVQSIPTNGVYFAASTTQNWRAVIRKNNVDLAYIDTGVSTSTTDFQKMRVEVASSSVNFLINGNIVAATSSMVSQTGVTLKPIILVQNFSGVSGGTGDFSPQMQIALIRYWLDDPAGGSDPSGGGESTSLASPYDRITGADIAAAMLADAPGTYVPGMLVVGDSATTTTTDVRKSNKRYDSPLMGVVSTAPREVLGQETGDTIRVAQSGRVPVIVSLENGKIQKGDTITSSSILGVGMKAVRVGSSVGRALENFDGSGTQCDASVVNELVNAGVEVPEGACLARVMVALDVTTSFSMGNFFQDAVATLADIVSASNELSADVFDKGVAYTKLVVQQIVTKVAVVEKLYAAAIAVLPGGDITLPAGTNQITGTGTLTTGSTSVFIANTKVTATTKVFITLRGLSESPLAVTEIKPGEGFTVATLHAPGSDVAFDWLMIITYDAATMTATTTPNGAFPNGLPPGDPTITTVLPPTDPGTGTTTGSGGDTVGGMTPPADAPPAPAPAPAPTPDPTPPDITTPAGDTTPPTP